MEFYNQRRKQCLAAQPNKAHKLIAQLEKEYDVTVITQNVDNLHERAGSTKVIHLHGELVKSESTVNKNLTYECLGEIHIGDLCEQQSQLRPHIVWFGEMLNNNLIDESIRIAKQADVCIVVGTSLQVYPANTLPHYVPESSQMVLIDPLAEQMTIEGNREIHYIAQKATEGMKLLFESESLYLKKKNRSN